MNRQEADSALAKRDESIRALPLLLDSKRLQEALQSRPDWPESSQLEIDYVRYKPGESLLARFQCLTGSVAFTGYAKGYAHSAKAKLKKSALRNEHPSEIGPGRWTLDDYGAEVVLFPNDNALAGIGGSAQHERLARIIDRAFKNENVTYGESFSILSYKPERRLTIRVELSGGDSAILKFFDRTRFKHSLKCHRRLAELRGLELPKLRGYTKKHHVLALGWISGEMLDRQIMHGDISSVSATAEALANFHLSSPRPLPRNPAHGMSSNLAELAEFLGAIQPQSYSQAANIAESLNRKLTTKLGETSSVHGDFNAQQVILEKQRVGLIDFDNARIHSPALDVGSFLARLEFDVLRGAINQANAGRIGDEFTRAYIAANPAVTEAHIKPFLGLALFRLAPIAFRQRMDNWPDVTHQILQRSEQALSAAARTHRG